MINSQIMFFMNEKDEKIFLDFALKFIDRVEVISEEQQYFHIGPQFIQFLNCHIRDNILLTGRIAIRTDSDDKETKYAEKIFNKFRYWLKKNYSNQLTCRNQNVPGSQMPIKDIWIGPDTLEQLKTGNGPQLKQSRKGFVLFELAGTNE